MAAQKQAQPAAAGAAQSEGLADSVDLAAWVAAVRPRIEQLSGRAFTRDVPVRTVTQDQFAEILAVSIEEDMRRRDPDADALKRHVLAMSAAYRVATRTLGAYRYEDRSLLVIPESAERLGRTQGWSVQTRERVIRLAAAHELVHALQDQTTDVRTRIADARGDQLTALIAVLEGQAILVTDQLAAELAWQSAGSALFRLVAPEESPGGRPDPQAPPVTRLAPTASTYRLGAEFIRNEYAQGGIDRVWALVADPPREVSSIGQLSPKETPGSGP